MRMHFLMPSIYNVFKTYHRRNAPQAYGKMKPNKAAGLSGLIVEMIKAADSKGIEF